MDYDFKTERWGYDARRFERYKSMFHLIKSKSDWADEHRENIRRWMRGIQQDWPQFIKEDEIP